MGDHVGTSDTEWRIHELFSAPGVFRQEHVVLTSGLHSDVYFNKRAISESKDNPELLDLAAGLLADLVQDLKPEAIVSPAEGAIPFGRKVAEILSSRYGRQVIYVTAKKSGKKFHINQPYRIWLAGKRVVVVEDIFTTGTSTANVASTLERLCQITPTAVVGLLDRSNGHAQEAIPGITLRALKTVPAHNWTWDECKAEGPCSRGEEICTEPHVGHGDVHVAEYGQPPYAA